MLKKLKSFFAHGNHAQWDVFCLFAFTLFIECILFHWNCFHSILISSLLRAPYEFFSFWCHKVAVALFFASFVFVFKRSWWTIIFSFVFDVWILANLIYFRSNAAFLDVFALSMTGNMDGFWSSVWFYCSWKDSIYFIISIVYAVLILIMPSIPYKRHWTTAVIIVILSYLISIGGLFSMTRRCGTKVETMFYNPISLSMRTTLSSLSYNDHVKDFTLLHSVGFIIVDEIENIKARQDIVLNETDEGYIKDFIQKDNNNPTYSSPLILILVESLEEWGVNEVSTPYLYSFMQTHHCFHATKVTKQTKGGTSADGQMLLNTGLLPINQGAACFRFPTNKYPSIGECCTGRSTTILPHEIGVWNQQYMSPAYAYDTTIIRNENDSLLFKTTIDCLHNGYQMVQTITMSSHSPFQYGASHSNLELPQNMPDKYMTDYLKSLHYMDAGLQVLLSKIDSDTLLSKATIVITGDHTIFPDEMRADFARQCHKENLPFRIEDAFVPLIIFSPYFKESVLVSDTCYQMDIYPTIMHLIGCEDYYWKGFGVNLMDSVARNNRPVSEQEAYELSDKLIRSNYFAPATEQTCKADNQHYIAHAGGAIDGFIYTNSLEAVENALNHGLHFIELDLEFTSDNRLVATHGWQGCEYWLNSEGAPSYGEFMAHKIYERFTPLDKEMIDSIMLSNPNLSLVTDKISTPSIIDSLFRDYKERIWVECFLDEDYYTLNKLGYHVLRSEYPPHYCPLKMDD